MAAGIFPDAIWRPYPGKHGNRPTIATNTMVIHSMASANALGVWDYFTTAGVDSTFLVPRVGPPIQGLSIFERSWANLAANDYASTFECENTLEHGDPTTDAGFNADLFTDNQLRWLQLVAEWQHSIGALNLDGVDYPGESGIGWHREYASWGNTACPGDARLAQIVNVLLPRIAGGTPATNGGLFMAGEVTSFSADALVQMASAINAGGAANAVIVALGNVLRQRGMADAEVKAHIDQVVGHLAPAQRNVVVRDGRDQSVWVTDGQTKRPAGRDLQLERFFAGQPGDIVPLTAPIAAWLDAIPLAG